MIMIIFKSWVSFQFGLVEILMAWSRSSIYLESKVGLVLTERSGHGILVCTTPTNLKLCT